jgi:hypothetical protein
MIDIQLVSSPVHAQLPEKSARAGAIVTMNCDQHQISVPAVMKVGVSAAPLHCWSGDESQGGMELRCS